jgi:hypothetical protein
MKFFGTLFLLILPIVAAAHPGGGLIALDANAVIFGDPANNVLWRMEKGKKPEPVFKNFHVHWTTLGLDGNIYAESFQEMGGALFRIDLGGTKHVKVAEEVDLNAPVFAVGKEGELIFQKDRLIVQRSVDGVVTPFRGSGKVEQGEPFLQQVIAYAWAPDGTLYLSDGNRLRRIESDGIVRIVVQIDGKLLEPKIWNSTGAARIWSIAIDSRKRVYTALPDIGQVIRIDPNGSHHVVDRYPGEWRVTAVATFGDAVFMLESSDKRNVGQRVRVIRGAGKAEMFGQVEIERQT